MTEIDLNTIHAVVYRFFLGLDRRDNHMVAGLMAEEGVWHRQGSQLIGRAEVLAALEARDPKRRTAHTVTNLWIESATLRTVRVHYYLIAYETVLDNEGREGSPKMLSVRQGTDDLVLEGGSWRVQSKQSRRLLPAE